jgi:aspartate/methionine/tyrosine aminotransferase
MSLASIQELNALSFRDELSSAYEESYGSPPFDLSHWDPSGQTLRALLVHLKLPPLPCVLPYILPYELGEIKESVIKRLGLSPNGRDTLVVPTGTSAIAFSAWWLKVFNVERVLVLCPAYFSSFYAFDMMRLDYSRVYLRREFGEWRWPYEEIISAVGQCRRTAVWITNPIYTTGVYLDDSHVDFLNSLLAKEVVVVLDECHAINGQELGPRLKPSEHLLGLYSPHKSVCVNAAKFAAIVFDVKYRRFFADWTDVLVGGLSAANYAALLHFLGPNFREFYNAFTEHINAARSEVIEVISRYGGALEIDRQSQGYLTTVYAPKVAAVGSYEDLLRDIVFSTGATMIPGTRNHFSKDIGFNFRVNLARACPQFTSALNRVAAHLASAV